MPGWFRRTRPQKIHPESVCVFCERHLEDVLQEAEKSRRSDGQISIAWTQMMLANVELVNMWRRHFYPGINKALEAPDISSQRIAIRKFLLDTTEHAAIHRAFLWTGIEADRIRKSDECEVLMNIWDADAVDLKDATFRPSRS